MILKQLKKGIDKIIAKINPKDLDKLAKLIETSKRVYLAGEGRSGLVAKIFALRLVSIGKKTSVVGDIVTPPMLPKDLLIIVSGSGETSSLLDLAKISKILSVKVVLVTATKKSALQKFSHKTFYIPSGLPKRQNTIYQLRELIGAPERDPLDSLFELCAHIFFEAVSAKLIKKNNHKK